MRPCSRNTFCPLSLSGVASGNTRMYAEYKITGCMPLSSDGEKPVVCSCSAGVFPKNYLTNTTSFNDFTKFAVCVLIPVIFVSPISKDNVSAGSSNSSSDLFQRFCPSASRDNDFQLKGNICLKCSAASARRRVTARLTGKRKTGRSISRCASICSSTLSATSQLRQSSMRPSHEAS